MKQELLYALLKEALSQSDAVIENMKSMREYFPDEGTNFLNGLQMGFCISTWLDDIKDLKTNIADALQELQE